MRGGVGNSSPAHSPAATGTGADTVTFEQRKTFALTIVGKGKATANKASLTDVQDISKTVCDATDDGAQLCTFTYYDSQAVTFTTSAASGWDFRSFSGAISCAGATCTWTDGSVDQRAGGGTRTLTPFGTGT